MATKLYEICNRVGLALSEQGEPSGRFAMDDFLDANAEPELGSDFREKMAALNPGEWCLFEDDESQGVKCMEIYDGTE